jgi:hypothetical protein
MKLLVSLSVVVKTKFVRLLENTRPTWINAFKKSEFTAARLVKNTDMAHMITDNSEKRNSNTNIDTANSHTNITTLIILENQVLKKNLKRK